MAGPQVLILEDDDLVRAGLVEMLERAHYQPVAIANGAQGLARLPDLHPALILLDMMMPEVDGFEFLSRLRANPAWAHIPVFIISDLGQALLRAIDRRGGQALGVAGILPKSVLMAEVVERVRSIVGPREEGDTLSRG